MEKGWKGFLNLDIRIYYLFFYLSMIQFFVHLFPNEIAGSLETV